MKDFIEAIKTNENGARTKTLIALGITATAVAAGIYFTKKGNATPVVLVVEDVADVITENPTI